MVIVGTLFLFVSVVILLLLLFYDHFKALSYFEVLHHFGGFSGCFHSDFMLSVWKLLCLEFFALLKSIWGVAVCICIMVFSPSIQCVLFHYVIFVIFTFLPSFSHSIYFPVCLHLPTDSWCSGKFPTMWIHFCFLFTSVCLLNFFILQITMVSMNCTNWMLITQRHRNTLVDEL